MKIFDNKKLSFLRFVCAFILCAGIIGVVTMCEDDDNCKYCTNIATNEGYTFCGDELEEAESLPNFNCR